MLATFTVNSPLDNTTGGDGFTTLREAIIAADLLNDADIIQFASGELKGELKGTGVIFLWLSCSLRRGWQVRGRLA